MPRKILMLVFTIYFGDVYSQEQFEIDAKAGYAYSVLANWEGNSGYAVNLNVGLRANKNCFGLAFTYYNQSFQVDETDYPNQYYSGGVYYAYQLIEKPKFVGRLGAALSIGVANSWFEYSLGGIYPKTYEAIFAPKLFFNGHYKLTKQLALSYEVGLHLFALGDGIANSGIVNFSPLLGFTYLPK